mgnify:CR=1 FL=1
MSHGSMSEVIYVSLSPSKKERRKDVEMPFKRPEMAYKAEKEIKALAHPSEVLAQSNNFSIEVANKFCLLSP